MADVELTIGFEQTEVPVGVLFAALRLLERMYYAELFLQLPSSARTLDLFERYLYQPEYEVSPDDLLVISEITITPDASSKAQVKAKGKHDTLDNATKKAKEYLEGIKKIPRQPPVPTNETREVDMVAIREVLKRIVPMLNELQVIQDRLARAITILTTPLRRVTYIEVVSVF